MKRERDTDAGREVEPTVETLRAEIRRMDPKLKEDDPAFSTAVLLLALLVTKHTIKALVEFTGLPREFVRERLVRLQMNGVLRGGKIYADWEDEENGGIAFWMDVNVAEGLLMRSR